MSTAPTAPGPTPPGRPVTLITGASSGFGAALAPRFARDGDTVVLTARREAELSAVADAIRAQGGDALAFPLDVADGAAVAAVVAEVTRLRGPVTRLVANAGISDPTRVERWNTARLQHTFAVNVAGVSHCIEQVLPSMLERRSGHLVAIASLAGLRGLPGSASYSASKAAVIALMESLRIELQHKGVKVSTILPGFVKTPMTAKNRFPMPFLMDLEPAADRMHRAIVRQKKEYAFPWQLATLVRLARLLPNAIYDRALAGKRVEKG